MNKVKVLIVEDEAIIANDISDALEDFGYETIEPANTYTEAIQLIEKYQPHIAILDIKLSGAKSGIDLASEINMNYHFPFIFLSSNTDQLTLSQAKNVQPFAYLVKPFVKEELYTSIEVALYNYAKQNEKTLNANNLIIKDALFVKEKKAFHRINFSEIVYLQSDHIYIDIYTVNGKKVSVRGSLNDYMSKLSNSFFRSHRSYIVNLDFITSINNNKLQLGGIEIPMGLNQREELLALLNKG